MTADCTIATTSDARCDLIAEHEIDRALCADLERVADGLPRLPDPASLRRLCERLSAASERWRDRRWEAALGRALAWETRVIDSTHAEDVLDALWRHWRDPTPASTGQLSYMLRALFDGRRRAIALEESQLGCGECRSSAID